MTILGYSTPGVTGCHTSATHDMSGRAPEAAVAFARAVTLGSQNFYPFYRVAADIFGSGDPTRHPEAEAHARRALALNPHHGSSHSLLGVILAHGSDPSLGLASARRGVELDQTSSGARLALATVLWRMHQNSQALGQALAGRSLARTDAERADAQQVIDAITPPVPGQ